MAEQVPTEGGGLIGQVCPVGFVGLAQFIHYLGVLLRKVGILAWVDRDIVKVSLH